MNSPRPAELRIRPSARVLATWAGTLEKKASPLELFWSQADLQNQCAMPSCFRGHCEPRYEIVRKWAPYYRRVVSDHRCEAGEDGSNCGTSCGSWLAGSHFWWIFKKLPSRFMSRRASDQATMVAAGVPLEKAK